MISKLMVTLLFYSHVQAQDSDCNFVQAVTPGTSYYIENLEYPRNFTRQKLCRWIGNCQNGYNCRIDCRLQLATPSSPTSCGNGDRVLVSRSGDESLTGAESFCGTINFQLLSYQNKIVVGLIVTVGTLGGKFQCLLSSQLANPDGNCRCGETRASRIVNGVITGVNEYPMMAGLIDSGNQICGGSIITRSYILTAAHCFFTSRGQRPTSGLRVVVGNYNINIATPYAVNSVTIHPNYNRLSDTYDYDIGLVETTTRFQFSVNVGPVCLPFRYINTNLVGQKVTILGWGTIDSGAPPSQFLRKVNVTVVPLSRCRAEYPQRNITERRLCTFEPGKDSCQMDSGGPLLLTNPSSGLVFLVGTVSFGDFCAEESSSVNMLISALLNFILNVVRPENVCVKDVS